MNETTLILPAIADGEDKSSQLKNRIRKNYRHVRKWAKRTNTDCFRVYDRDIKEYPLAIDFYAGRFCVQYFSYNRENDEPPPELETEVLDALYSIFAVDPERIYWRTRVRRTKMQQYEKLGEEKQFFIVHEYGVKLKVNLYDYLDTGLFLDHRETRQIVAKKSVGKRLLNLFAYTCSLLIYRIRTRRGGAKILSSIHSV
jgi:23S rRNA G2069 N7-methylase RlmK/C1962 C5-methylase RlmI